MDNVLIGRLIADLRKQRGMTQQELADILGLSNKTISKWESGMGFEKPLSKQLLIDFQTNAPA